MSKIIKANNATPDEFETQIAQEIATLENSAEFNTDLAGLYITAAKEVEIDAGRKAIVLFVPFKQLKDFNKIKPRFVRELEKKTNGRSVIIVAQRTILSKTSSRSALNKGPRSRSRTLTAVHDAILNDIVYPSEIVGKRIRYKVDGSKILKIHLDQKSAIDAEPKVETFAKVYKALTNKDVVFEFPADN